MNEKRGQLNQAASPEETPRSDRFLVIDSTYDKHMQEELDEIEMERLAAHAAMSDADIIRLYTRDVISKMITKLGY